MRGYFGVGIVGGKCAANVGTLWRSAYQLGASFIFTAGARYPQQACDTVKAFRHVPMFEWASVEDLTLPAGCEPILVEMGGRMLDEFQHPERAVYILGAEDHGVPPVLLARKWRIVSLPCVRTASFNVAVAGSLVMMHRLMQRNRALADTAAPETP